jgi:GNAT superfamily N-acetyltransferase
LNLEFFKTGKEKFAQSIFWSSNAGTRASGECPEKGSNPGSALYRSRKATNFMRMDQDVFIREAAVGELAGIEALVREAYGEFRPLFPEKVWEAWMANIGEVIRSESGILLVAEDQGKVRGAVKFFPQAGQSGMGQWPQHAAAIRILAVSPEARGRGYGTLLSRECLRRAKAMRISTIFLFTGEFMHAARHIYEKLGFRRVPEFDRDPGPIAYRLDL